VKSKVRLAIDWLDMRVQELMSAQEESLELNPGFGEIDPRGLPWLSGNTMGIVLKDGSTVLITVEHYRTVEK
jgi:hypothetical protein